VMKETRNVRATLDEVHYPALSKWLAVLYPEKFRELLRSPSRVGSVTYGEYSADLQLEVLGIDPGRIRQPFIDIGCGSRANLVIHLRSLGVEAYGIDRQLDVQASYLWQADWFDFRFEPGRWGTVAAHMSFTNHLNYAYLHDLAQLERYLEKMKEILESLAVGGSFYYAPGLPFLEQELSAVCYRVYSEQRPGGVRVSRVDRLA